MRIAIDISQIVYETGVSVYTKALVRNLIKIDQENEYVLFGGALNRRVDLAKYTKNIIPFSPKIADFFWNRLHILNIEKFIGEINVLHSSDWSQPPTKAFKVTTVHDLSPIKYPNETPRIVVETHKRRLYWVLKEVDRIIVPTNSIKNEMIELGADSNKIRVIYEGVDEIFIKQRDEDIISTKKKFKIHDNYLLAVGVGERKNTKRIIEAFEKTKNKGKLVIVGGNKPPYADRRGIIYTGRVSDKELSDLYSGAKALVYASLYEGFGLPILQAFSCQCPVVTSNIGAMKEVAQEGAVLVDPQDANSIAEGINKAVSNPKTLAKKGLRRVKDFSWEKCAKETLNVYKEYLNKL